jgi:molybdenum cofactor cytidylyltransferase
LERMKPVVILLAAGRGERFAAAGGQGHKLDARLGDQTVRAHALQAVRDSGLEGHLVTPADTAHLAHAGMADSIACGVRATANAAGWLILPADLPLVLPRTVQAVAQALMAGTHDVVVPTFQGERGHPVGFTAACRDDLLALHGDQGARAVVRAHAVQLLAVDDAGCVLDVDTPAALARAQALWQQRQNA